MKAFLVILVSLTILHFGLCLRCYTCDSSKDAQCADISNEKYVLECGRPYLQTMKAACQKQVVKDKIKNTETTLRKCVLVQNNTPDCTPSDSNMEMVQCSTCETDLCNGVGIIQTSFLTVILCTAAAYFVTNFVL